MWNLKGCPRCGGDIYLDRDRYGWYEQCLQCGYLSELQSLAEFKEGLADKEKELVLTV